MRRRPLEFAVRDHVFLKVIPKRGVVRFGKREKVIAAVHWTFRDTRDGRHNCVPASVIAQYNRCPRGVSRLHAPEIYSRSSSCGGLGDRLRLTPMRPLRRDQCAFWIAVIRFCDARP